MLAVDNLSALVLSLENLGMQLGFSAFFRELGHAIGARHCCFE